MDKTNSQKIIERGLEAKQFLENPIYQKVLNTLIDESIGAWATAKMEEKDKREAAWHKYQSVSSLHGTLQSWVTAMKQEQQYQEKDAKKPDNKEIH